MYLMHLNTPFGLFDTEILVIVRIGPRKITSILLSYNFYVLR